MALIENLMAGRYLVVEAAAVKGMMRSLGTTYTFPPDPYGTEGYHIEGELLDFFTANMDFHIKLEVLDKLAENLIGPEVPAIRHAISEALCISQTIALEMPRANLAFVARNDPGFLRTLLDLSALIVDKLAFDDEDDV